MYAQLCKRLSEEAPNFEPADSASTFRLLLLNKCKLEFDNRASAVASAFDCLHNNTTDLQPEQQQLRRHGNNEQQPEIISGNDDERKQFAKRKMLGNIKFIGELGKLEILSEGILHRCIQELLVRRAGGDDDPSEDLECLCQILRTCGRNLDTHRGNKLMEQYFGRMKSLCENLDLPPRIRFMLRDICDLRQDNWVPRKATVVEGPMPINQIRPNDDDRLLSSQGGGGGGGRDGGGGYRNRDRNNHYNNHDRDQDRGSNNMSELFRHPMKTRGDLDGMLMHVSLTSNSPNLIPTGGGHHHQFGGSNGFTGGGGGGNQRDGGFRGHNNQRSGGGGGGFNNYNNQRGQYKHNQNNTNNSQYNNQSNKEVAPRFKKNLIVGKEEIGDVELRPTSMLYNKANQTVKSNNIMNNNSSGHRTMMSSPMDSPFNNGGGTTNTTQTTGTTNVQQTSLLLKQQQPLMTPLLMKEPLPIKQVTIDKTKQSKRDKGPTKDEVLKKVSSLLNDYWKGNFDLKQTVNSYKEFKVPDKFAKEVIVNALSAVLDKSEVEQEKFIKLLSNLKESNILNGNIIQDAFKSLCNMLDERENELIKAISSTSVLLANGIIENLISLMEVAALTENGTHYPLFLLVLQQINQKQTQSTFLSDLFNKSKINLLTQLPESDKTKERLSEILDEYDLTFLYPLLRIQAELSKQLQTDPNPQSYYKWIKDNIDANNYTEPGFINALMTVLLKYITEEAALVLASGGNGGGGDDKVIADKEKAMLERYQHILQAFLHENHSLQLIAVYSLQVHFYSLGFPRGELLRWFIALYDLEIIEEEAFLNWREDVTDAYPGKGQALFQVNQWLTWLQNAESEEEEGED